MKTATCFEVHMDLLLRGQIDIYISKLVHIFLNTDLCTLYTICKLMQKFYKDIGSPLKCDSLLFYLCKKMLFFLVHISLKFWTSAWKIPQAQWENLLRICLTTTRRYSVSGWGTSLQILLHWVEVQNCCWKNTEVAQKTEDKRFFSSCSFLMLCA